MLEVVKRQLPRGSLSQMTRCSFVTHTVTPALRVGPICLKYQYNNISVDFGVIWINTPSLKSEKFVHSNLFLPDSCHRGGKEKQQGNFPLSFPSCPFPLLWPLRSPLCLLALPFPAFNSVPPFSLTLGLTFSFLFWSPNGSLSCFFCPGVLFYLMPHFLHG